MKNIILPVLFLFSSCSDQNMPIQMSSIHRDKADTIYLEKIVGLRDSLDTACSNNFEIEVQIALDSILKVRKIEEQKIRSRIKVNEQ
ncbi:MAG: hypothetical protein RJA52_711 [Bacteroidota bacterium]|jgi:hypothetical protein